MRNQCSHSPGPLQKCCKISSKRDSATRPPKIFNFQPHGASGWQHEPKRLPKGFLLGGAGSTKNSSKRDPKCGREPTPQNGPSFSPNGCQNVFPKQYNLAQILSKEVSRNVLNETNSGKQQTHFMIRRRSKKSIDR